MSTARLFVAIPLNPDLRAALGDAVKELSRSLPGVKWVHSDSTHITIRFLGETPLAALESIDSAVSQAVLKHRTVRCDVGGLGVFPHVRRPAVIWSGVTRGEDAVCALAEDIREALTVADFGEDKHDFSAHITLGRVRRGSRIRRRALSELLSAWEGRRFGTLAVDQVILYKSTLTREGAIYEPVKRWLLQAP